MMVMLVRSNKYSTLKHIYSINNLFYRKILRIISLIIFIVTMPACTKFVKNKAVIQQEAESLRILHTNLQKQSEWIKVHTAEFLLWLGYPEGVKEVFLEEERRFEHKTPYRIGIWRVLAQAETRSEKKEKWINKIVQAFIDEFGEDRIHAAETLAKLRISPLVNYPDITKKTLNSPIKNLSLYTRWSTCYTSPDSLLNVQNFFLNLATSKNEDFITRSIASYVIRQLNMLDTEQWNNLALSALSEFTESNIKINLLNTAFVTANDDLLNSELYDQVSVEFLNYRESRDYNTRINLADGLAEKGQLKDIDILRSFLEDEKDINDPVYEDVRSFVSYAVLRILDRERK